MIVIVNVIAGSNSDRSYLYGASLARDVNHAHRYPAFG